MPNDVSVAAIHEEVDTADGRTIVVRDSWDALGHDGFHIDTDKGRTMLEFTKASMGSGK